MDWRRFNVDVVADFLKWESDFYHSLRPEVPTTTNLDGPLNNWYSYKKRLKLSVRQHLVFERD